eukprot:6189017-Pleurochrysis_carterae.AAC.2
MYRGAGCCFTEPNPASHGRTALRAAAEPRGGNRLQALSLRPSRQVMSSAIGTALDNFVATILAKKAASKGGDGKLSNLDQAFVEAELNALKDKVKEYEQMTLLMVEQKSNLTGQLGRQMDDQKDIFQYLNGELAKKTDEIVALEEKVERLENESEQMIRKHESKLQQQVDIAEQEQVFASFLYFEATGEAVEL